MSEQRRLCQVKDAMRDIGQKLVAETHRTPGFLFLVDELRCPRRNHCDLSRPCEAWKDRVVRQRVAKIEDQLFVLGFARADSNDVEDFSRKEQR